MVALRNVHVALAPKVIVGGVSTSLSTTGAGVPSHHLTTTVGGLSATISGTRKPNIETKMCLRVVRS